MKSRPPRLICLALLAVVCLSHELTAQTKTSGGLTGVVTDQSKAVITDVEVEIKDIHKGNVGSTKTDHEGVCRFSFLAPSSYALTVTHAGFRKESRAVNVLLVSPGTVNVTLKIREASSEITVTDETPLIQAENGDVEATRWDT